jgi:predicted DNA-binding transcriptional regulator YafY
MSHGFIWYSNYGVKEKILVRWAKGETVSDIVKRAIVKGLQLEIEYLDDDGKATTRKIDIQSISGNKIRAYCHLRQSLRFFDITKITKAQDCGPMQSFQKSLL